MPTNKKEYMKLYFRVYVKNCMPQICDSCGGKYRKYNKHIHMLTKKHIKSIKKQNTIIQSSS